MIRTTTMWLVLAASLGVMGCGGGGGGGGGNGAIGTPDIAAPSPGTAVGTAGRMEGRWRVVSCEVVPDANNRNTDPGSTKLAPGTELRFQDGRLVALDDEDPGHPDPGRGQQSIPVHIDFLRNSPEGNVTVFLLGFTIGDNPLLGPGRSRCGMTIGTTSATTAEAALIEIQQIPRIGEDTQGLYHARLQRL